MNELAAVEDPRRASALLGHPIRTRILALARDPLSASELASRLGQPRQRVNYHVKQLAKAKFLRRAEQVRKRNLIEQRYVATARSYVLSPAVLGPLAADPRVADAYSAARLVAVAAQAQTDVSRAVTLAASRGKRLATLSMTSDVRFLNPAQREAFTRALQEAVVRIIAEHSAPARTAEGESAGRPFRFVLACYPSPDASPREQGDDDA